MQLGSSPRPAGTDPALVLRAARTAGYDAVQFNLACAGLPSLPDHIDDEAGVIARIVAASRASDVSLGRPFRHLQHGPPRPRKTPGRVEGAGGGHSGCGGGGDPAGDACTGTRHPSDQWAHHLDNADPSAWADMAAEMALALDLAESHGVDLGIEPEQANIVQSTADARRLIAQMGSGRLKIVFDPANRAEQATPAQAREIVARSIAPALGAIAMVHAKDRGGWHLCHGRPRRRRLCRSADPNPRHGPWRPADHPWVGGRGGPRRCPVLAGVAVMTDTVVFQHGLGGGEEQVAQNWPAGTGFRRITQPNRHDGTPLGSERPFSDPDVCRRRSARRPGRICGRRNLDGRCDCTEPCLVIHPERVRALILIRPAPWTFLRHRPTCSRSPKSRRCCNGCHPMRLPRRFAIVPPASTLRRQARTIWPRCWAMRRGPGARAFAQVLQDIATQPPRVSLLQAQVLRLPCLIIGNEMDAVHPMSSAEALAEAIPNALLIRVAPKAQARASVIMPKSAPPSQAFWPNLGAHSDYQPFQRHSRPAPRPAAGRVFHPGRRTWSIWSAI